MQILNTDVTDTNLKLAVLYADVSGSTRLYETFGDDIASSDIHICLDLLTDIAEQHRGRKVKTIGDEVMCSFQRASDAARASIEMNRVLRGPEQENLFQSRDIHIKTGWHFGLARTRTDDILGEAPLLAQQVINMAKRDEILTTQKSIDELPPELKASAIFIDRCEAEDGSGQLDVYALPWNEDDSDATVVTSTITDVSGSLADRALLLHYQGQVLEMTSENSHCQVGRGEDNQLVVHGEFTSRHHGEIYYRHGRFHLSDMSTNGTGVIHSGEKFVRLHREEKILHGKGTICFGGEPNSDPKAAVDYECIPSET